MLMCSVHASATPTQHMKQILAAHPTPLQKLKDRPTMEFWSGSWEKPVAWNSGYQLSLRLLNRQMDQRCDSVYASVTREKVTYWTSPLLHSYLKLQPPILFWLWLPYTGGNELILGDCAPLHRFVSPQTWLPAMPSGWNGLKFKWNEINNWLQASIFWVTFFH